MGWRSRNLGQETRYRLAEPLGSNVYISSHGWTLQLEYMGKCYRLSFAPRTLPFPLKAISSESVTARL